MRFDPHNLEALVGMKPPTHADKSMQLLCASNWMRTAIPPHAEFVALLRATLDRASTDAYKRTKRALPWIGIRDMWGAEQATVFE